MAETTYQQVAERHGIPEENIITARLASIDHRAAELRESLDLVMTERSRLQDELGSIEQAKKVAAIVKVCQDAAAAGKSMRKAVAAHTGRSDGAAHTLITRLRKAGHPIPHLRQPRQPPLSAPTDRRKVLACTESGCEVEFEVQARSGMAINELRMHTIREHGRRPTADERTPVRA